MIDSGSLVTIFTIQELKKILGTSTAFARPIPATERYVDFNKRSLNLIGFIHVDVQVGDKANKKAQDRARY